MDPESSIATSAPRPRPGVVAFLRGLLPALGLWIPSLVASGLVAFHAVNVPFFDDWWLADDWLRFRAGQLSWGDLFQVQMEHRLVLPRALSLLMHGLFGGDLRAQTGLTLLFLQLIALMMLWLLKRSLGPLKGLNWGIGFALMLAIFSPVQWQPMLWPIIFTMYLSAALFLAAVAVWFTRWPDWVALVLSLLAAIGGTLTFATGMLIWGLVPLAILLARPTSLWRRRWIHLAVWIAVCAVTLGLYFQDTHNSVHPEYAYGQGDQNTMGHSLDFVRQHPAKLPPFVAAALGGNLARGHQFENIATATTLGFAAITAFVAACAALGWMARRDGLKSLVPALPWVLVGSFSAATAVMLAFGRMWIGDGLPQAITPRYTTHAIFLTAALPPLLALAGRRWWPRGRVVGLVALTFLVALQITQWTYGANMMEIWRNARLSDLALTRFVKLLVHNKAEAAFSGTAGNGEFGCRVALELDRQNFLDPPMVPDDRLSNLRVERKALEPGRQAGFTGWETGADGKVTVSGYATVGGGRPADLVLFTQEKDGDDRIVALRQPVAIGTAAGPKIHRDYEFTRVVKPESPERYNWSGVPVVLGSVDPAVPIRAWAYDALRRRVFPVPDLRPEQATRPRLREAKGKTD